MKIIMIAVYDDEAYKVGHMGVTNILERPDHDGVQLIEVFIGKKKLGTFPKRNLMGIYYDVEEVIIN